ncbi:S1 RNA-binding domain-containing protein [Streptomyces rimosus]|uniref:S1 RNA-binding domain-containing protein n=1 Tax=Streptomyces rimosus TaxID=1927 RepID=UPI000B10BE93|nr:S1 RNA-binding domain-containing protein [Streptomyces rimosus]
MTYPLPSTALTGFLMTLRPGDVVAGVVAGIKNFGVFVDIDGAPEASVGFIPPPELSWRRISSCHEAVSLGQRVTAEVLSLDIEMRGQAVLSLVALQPSPWSLWADRVGSVVRGRVTKLAPFGVFVRLDDGVAGLVHHSELPPAKPQRAVRIGEEMTVRITEVDVPTRRIRLSLAKTDDAGTGS